MPRWHQCLLVVILFSGEVRIAKLCAATAGVTTPGGTNYPNVGMREVVMTVAKDSPAGSSVYRSFYGGVIDETNGYAYFTTAAAVNPGHIVKFNIKESPTILREVAEADASSGESNLDSGVIDVAAGYAYFTATGSPGHIVRFGLGIGDSPPTHSAADSLILNSGDNQPLGMIIDTSNSDVTRHYAYICTLTTPGRIIKVNLSKFQEVSELVLSSGVGDGLRRGVIDPANGVGYFATSGTTSPPRLVKFSLGAGDSQPQLINSIALDTVNNSIGSVVIDVSGGFIYCGSYVGTVPAKIYKVPLNGAGLLTGVLTTSLSFSGRELCSAIIDPIGGYAYFGTDHTYPGKIHKVRLENATSQPTHIGYLAFPQGSVTPLPPDGSNFTNSPPALYGLVYLQSAVAQLSRGYAYFGTDSQPGQVVQVALGHAGAIKATRLVLGDTAYVTDVRFLSQTALGNVRLAIYGNASPMNLLWQSPLITNTGGTLVSQVGSTPLTLAQGTYWLAWQCDNAGDVPSYVAGSPGNGFTFEQDFGAFPTTLTGVTFTSDNWTMYLNYSTVPMDGWRAAKFGSASNSGPAADSADPNADGLSNLVEYALNGDPVGGTTGTTILPQSSFGSGNALQLSFAHYLDRTDLTLTVQAADTLSGPWTDLARSAGGNLFQVLTPGASVNEPGAGNPRPVTVTDLYQKTDAAHPRRYMKLEVSH